MTDTKKRRDRQKPLGLGADVFRRIIADLRPGGRTDLNVNPKLARMRLCRYSRATGKSFTTRVLADGTLRIWRVDGTDGTDAPTEAT